MTRSQSVELSKLSRKQVAAMRRIYRSGMNFGTSIPESMKPWVKELSRRGKLLGENGEKIAVPVSLTEKTK